MRSIRFIFAIAAITASTSAMAGATDKATGSGSWVNANGVSQYAVFDAHEALDNRPAKGHHYQETSLNGGGTWSIDIDEVYVYAESGRACFGGTAYSATGSLGAFLGRRVYVAVADGGAAGNETGMDLLRAGAVSVGASAPAWCLNGDFGANQYWSEGNVQIHAGKAHTD